uniref:Leucine-rich repeat receptor-like protein kinase n=1 Tax=Pohlia nutans TaxID=140635 RepID=A0A1P8DYX2_9BRYO|nr:leucine-rich repeat receptor-like protein kinase [Pohlia nutans]
MHTCTLWGGLPPSWGNMRNISKLLIYNNDLTGYIPSSWQAMTALKQLHVGQNTLSGPFPDWIVNIPIELLDMSRNSLQGSLPDLNINLPLVKATQTNMSLYCNYFNGSYPTFQLGDLVNITGNCFTNESTRDADNTRNTCNRPFFCRDFFMRLEDGCAPCPAGNYIYDNKTICTCKPADYVEDGGGGKFPYGEVIGGIVGSLLLVIALVALCKWEPIHKRLPFDPFALFSTEDDDEDWEVPEGVHRFTMAELSKATGHFNREHEIGSGGFGKVFFGTLADGKMVAIKRASTTSLQGQIEFRNEVNLLSRLHHRHLVRLEGFCEDQDLQILVYEFMKNGNLGEHIYRSKGMKVLRWYKRLEIAVGVAQGLDYLHSFADPPVIHRDVKPTNILLDEHMVAKVADFGISKATFDFNTHVSTRPAGTAGYLDPEYFLRRQLTTASDVYGYGVLLLEIITGQQAIDHSRKEEFNLIEWVRPRFRERGVESVVDVALDGDYDKEVFTDMTNVALMCASFNKNDRPAMKDVVSYLEPHVRAFQSLSSGSTEIFPSGRSLARGSDMERLTRQNPDDFLRSMQFMTVPLHTAGVDFSPFNKVKRPETM